MAQRKLISFFLLPFLWGGGLWPTSLLAAQNAPSLYKDLCASCHGATGKGDGPAAAALNPRPRDFGDCKIMAKDTDEILFKAIKGGSQSIGRSAMMPSWGGALTDEQIRDLASYVRAFCKK